MIAGRRASFVSKVRWVETEKEERLLDLCVGGEQAGATGVLIHWLQV